MRCMSCTRSASIAFADAIWSRISFILATIEVNSAVYICIRFKSRREYATGVKTVGFSSEI